MELANQNNQLSPNLDKEERQFIEARFSQKPKDLTDSEFKNYLLVLIGKAHVGSGQNVDNQLIGLAMPDLIDTINKYFSTLTLKEIELCFKLGLMGEFGEYYGLNNKTYFGWFKSLLGLQKRIEANRKQGAWVNAQNQPKALTDEEKRAIMIKASLEAFEYVKTGHYFNDMGNSVYNFIDRNWKIPFNAKRKHEFMELAKTNLINSKAETLLTSDKTHQIKGEIEAIREGIDKESVVIEAKKLIINEYFKEINLLGEHLKNIIS